MGYSPSVTFGNLEGNREKRSRCEIIDGKQFSILRVKSYCHVFLDKNYNRTPL
jgi:hypothetical protein